MRSQPNQHADAASPSAKRHGAPLRTRLGRWGLLGRFLAWWFGLFAFLSAFSICPICGQPGCAGGPVSAGVLGGLFALITSVLRPFRHRRRATPEAPEHAEHSEQQ